MTSTGVLLPLLVPLLSAGALGLITFLAILLFGLLAVRSLAGHIRKSRRTWEGEVDGAIPLGDDHAPEARTTDEPADRRTR